MSAERYWNWIQQEFLEKHDRPCSLKKWIGGHVFELRFPDQAAADAFPLPFFKSTEGEPEFRVTIWDAATASIPSMWSSGDYNKKGSIAGFADARYPLVYDLGSQGLSMAHLAIGEAFYWTPDLKSIPYWEKCSFLRNILHFLLPTKKKHLVHASAVGYSEGGVLLVGKGGSGKSTTAFSCLRSPLSYLADDYCALGEGNPPFAYNVYTTAKIDPAIGPSLSIKETCGKGEKIPIHVLDAYPDKMIQRLPIKAILCPTIENRRSPQIVPGSKAKALQQLSASTIFQLPGENREMLSFLSSIVRSTPCYSVLLSPDLQANAACLNEWISHDIKH